MTGETPLSKSLRGKRLKEIRQWAASYLKMRKIQSLHVEDFLTLASREEGTTRLMTKTKCRKAANRWLSQQVQQA